MKKQQTTKQRGFSLIEFAIVLFILALILGGIMGTGAWEHFIDRAEELDERQRAGFDDVAYELKTGKPCPVHKRQIAGVPADLLALCPPVWEDETD